MPEHVLNGDQVDVKSTNCESQENEEDSSETDVHFEPIVNLPLIEVSNNEEDEVEMIKLRAKLYRYDSAENPAEWKERGTGEVKLLRHTIRNTVRVVMRRDKTLKICANHFVTPWMELKPNCSSDRAWVWSVFADYTDEQLKPELLAIRFANAENASLWKEAFEKAKKIVETECEIYAGKTNPRAKIIIEDDSSSDISDTDTEEEEEEQKQSQISTEEKGDISQSKTEEKEDKATDEVATELEKLKVKTVDEKK